MTQEKDYIDLADRVEAAMPWTVDNSPHFHRMRATDVEIARLVKWDSAVGHGRGDRYGVPAYTASVDAAMTLVPEECCDWLFRRFEDGTFACDLEIVGERVQSIDASGASIPLALTAAALRCHASRVGDRRGEDGVSPHTKQAGTGAG